MCNIMQQQNNNFTQLNIAISKIYVIMKSRSFENELKNSIFSTKFVAEANAEFQNAQIQFCHNTVQCRGIRSARSMFSHHLCSFYFFLFLFLVAFVRKPTAIQAVIVLFPISLIFVLAAMIRFIQGRRYLKNNTFGDSFVQKVQKQALGFHVVACKLQFGFTVYSMTLCHCN